MACVGSGMIVDLPAINNEFDHDGFKSFIIIKSFGQ